MFILGIVYFSRGLKHPILILNDFEFKIERQSATRVMWCCKAKDKLRCRARIVSFADVIQLRTIVHNHPPTFCGVYSNSFNKELVKIERYRKWINSVVVRWLFGVDLLVQFVIKCSHIILDFILGWKKVFTGLQMRGGRVIKSCWASGSHFLHKIRI